MGNNLTLKTRYGDNEPVGENFAEDAKWLHQNRRRLFEEYGKGVIWVYRQQVIGFGDTIRAAESDAADNLLTNTTILPNTVVTPLVGFLGPGPYRRFQIVERSDSVHDQD